MFLLVLLINTFCFTSATSLSKSLHINANVALTSNIASAHHSHGIEKLDRKNSLDHIIAILEDPRVDLFVGLLAGMFALAEVLKDFKNIGAHHGLVATSLLHALKALTSVVKEGRRGKRVFHYNFFVFIAKYLLYILLLLPLALKGYNARFHN